MNCATSLSILGFHRGNGPTADTRRRFSRFWHANLHKLATKATTQLNSPSGPSKCYCCRPEIPYPSAYARTGKPRSKRTCPQPSNTYRLCLTLCTCESRAVRGGPVRCTGFRIHSETSGSLSGLRTWRGRCSCLCLNTKCPWTKNCNSNSSDDATSTNGSILPCFHIHGPIWNFKTMSILQRSCTLSRRLQLHPHHRPK